MHARLRAFLFGALAAVWLPVSASMVLTVDFDDMSSEPGDGGLYGPHYDKKFALLARFASAYSKSVLRVLPGPSGYLLWTMWHVWADFGVPNYDGTRWLGSDAGGPARLFDADTNLLFTTGLTQGIVRIDRNLDLFSALDFLGVQGGFTLTSSKGGLYVPH